MRRGEEARFISYVRTPLLLHSLCAPAVAARYDMCVDLQSCGAHHCRAIASNDSGMRLNVVACSVFPVLRGHCGSGMYGQPDPQPWYHFACPLESVSTMDLQRSSGAARTGCSVAGSTRSPAMAGGLR